MIMILVGIVIVVRLTSFAYLSSLAEQNPFPNPYPIVAGDSTRYAQFADNLLTLHAYDVPGATNAEWPPAYPMLLAVVKLLTGNFAWVVVVQILFAGLAAALIYRMARSLVPLPWACIPALIYAIDPLIAFTDTSVMTDGIFTALLVCVVYLAFFKPSARSLLCWSGIGVLIGILTLIRPIAEFLVFVFPAAYLLREWMENRGGGAAHWKPIGAFVLGCAIILLPWMIRNELFFGSFEVSNLGGYNLLTNDVRDFIAWRTLAASGHPLPAILVPRHINDPVFASVDKKINAALTAMTPPGGDRYSNMGLLAVQYIMQDPVHYAYFDAVNTLPFFFSSSIASYEQMVPQLRDNQGFYAPTSLALIDAVERIRHPASLESFMSALWSVAPIGVEILSWLCATLLALSALLLRRRDFAIMLCAIFVAYFAALTGPMSSSRYRIPAEPYLLILAVVGVYETTNVIRKRVANRSAFRKSAEA
jgi:hypothetical protein